MDVAAWLRELGLERYAQAFLDNDIAPTVLPELTEQDLRELGVSLGHRRLLWELRSAHDLARLRTGHGRRAQARDLLMPVYDWFTDGFETADPRNAKALLDELA